MVGQFFTPALVAECMFHLAETRPGDRVIDPSCGDGSFLRSAPAGLDLHGCEIDPRHAATVAPFLPAGNLVVGDALSSLGADWGTYDLAIGKAKELEPTDKNTAAKYAEIAALVEDAHKITPVKPDKHG